MCFLILVTTFSVFCRHLKCAFGITTWVLGTFSIVNSMPLLKTLTVSTSTDRVFFGASSWLSSSVEESRLELEVLPTVSCVSSSSLLVEESLLSLPSSSSSLTNSDVLLSSRCLSWASIAGAIGPTTFDGSISQGLEHLYRSLPWVTDLFLSNVLSWNCLSGGILLWKIRQPEQHVSKGKPASKQLSASLSARVRSRCRSRGFPEGPGVRFDRVLITIVRMEAVNARHDGLVLVEAHYLRFMRAVLCVFCGGRSFLRMFFGLPNFKKNC